MMDPKRWRTWYGGAVLVSLCLVGTTALHELVFERVAWWQLLVPWDLGRENNLAAWWSGILFFLAGLFAYDRAGEVGAHGAGEAAGRAWVVIAVILVFFSADEIGSLHERIGSSGRLAGDSELWEWIPLAILAVLLAGSAVVALSSLWRVPRERKAALTVLAGFSLLATVFVQEILEDRIPWSGAIARAVRRSVEEGTELVGALIILWATVPRAVRYGRTHGPRADRPLFTALERPGRRTGSIAAFACILLAWATANLPDQQRGHPADWLAAVAFLSTALVLARSRPTMRRAPGLAMLAGVASALAVALAPTHLTGMGPLWLNSRLALLSAVTACIGMGWSLRGRDLPMAAGLLLLAGAAVSAGLVWSLDLFVSYLATCVLGIGTYAAATRLDPMEPASPRPPSVG